MFLLKGFYSDGYQLADRCNRMIDRNLKDDRAIEGEYSSTLCDRRSHAQFTVRGIDVR